MGGRRDEKLKKGGKEYSVKLEVTLAASHSRSTSDPKATGAHEFFESF